MDCPTCGESGYSVKSGCRECHFGERGGKETSSQKTMEYRQAMNKPHDRRCQWLTGMFQCTLQFVGRNHGSWFCAFHLHLDLRTPTSDVREQWERFQGWYEHMAQDYPHTIEGYSLPVFFFQLTGVTMPAGEQGEAGAIQKGAQVCHVDPTTAPQLTQQHSFLERTAGE